MSVFINAEDAFEQLKTGVTQAIKDNLPHEGKHRRLVVNDVFVDDDKDTDDHESQLDAKLAKQSWTVPIRADLTLIDKKTEKPINRAVVKVGDLPKLTSRVSSIINGREYTSGLQRRLMSGIYTRQSRAGDFETQFNLKKGLGPTRRKGFTLVNDPASRKMKFRVTSSRPGESSITLPVYSLMRGFGATDSELEKEWGPATLAANKRTTVQLDKDLSRFKEFHKEPAPENRSDAVAFLREVFDSTELIPDTTDITLGKRKEKVDRETMSLAIQKLRDVSAGRKSPDDRNALDFAAFMGTKNLIPDRINRIQWKLKEKIQNVIDRPGPTTVRGVVSSNHFNGPIKGFFTSGGTIAMQSDQTNPLTMISDATMTTLMGEGGIGDDKRVEEDAKLISPSHLGFLDPIQTPEGTRTGITLPISMAARHVGTSLTTAVKNLKTGKTEWKTPAQLSKKVVAFPDQYRIERGKRPRPVSRVVKVSDQNNEIRTAKPSEVDFALVNPGSMFGIASSLVPFLPANQGARASMAVRQQDQAVSLKHREAPLVQVKPSSYASETMESLIGKFFAAHTTSTDGTVKEVTDKQVVVDAGGPDPKVFKLYNNFPLNEDGAFIHATPTVKVGDKVKNGDVIASTNFTDNKGTLALGTNLRTAYLPWKGLVFEDGLVVSEAAAKKLTSQHLYRHELDKRKGQILDRGKLLTHYKTKIPEHQAQKLDKDGVIRKGTRVEEGDILIGAIVHDPERRERSRLRRSFKGKIPPYSDRLIKWDQGNAGTVERVVKRKDGTVSVHVSADEPAIVGDKIVARHANKGVIVSILPDADMPKTKDGRITELLISPSTIPTRINPSQVLETAYSKIAEKTGKPVTVQNFETGQKSYLDMVKNALKRHGISDKEEMIDPETGKSLGKVMVGTQYFVKQRHRAAKKMSARGVGPDPLEPGRYRYDVNETPKGGGKYSAQTVDALGMWGLLAHGATNNLREMQSIKSDQNAPYWSALMLGAPLPAPRTPLIFQKFESHLRGLGLNVDKKGSQVQLLPATDKDTIKLAKASGGGEIKDPRKAVMATDLTEEKGGLFDVKTTGGGPKQPTGGGSKWAYFKLDARMPNPVFEKGIASLLGLKDKELHAVYEGQSDLDGKSGPTAIVKALSKLDVKKELKEAKEKIDDKNIPSGKPLDDLNKKIKYLSALEDAGVSAKDAYTMGVVPVLPPKFRPIQVLSDGNLEVGDLNFHYKMVGLSNSGLRDLDPILKRDPEERLKYEKALYTRLRQLMMTGMVDRGSNRAQFRSGIMSILAGKKAEGSTEVASSPKLGLFQNNLIGRRQDLSARGIIVPDPTLSIDEISMPKRAAMEVYRPFVVKRLTQDMGYTPIEALKAINESRPAALKALHNEVAHRPVLAKRDPALHKFNIMGFRPRISDNHTIGIHPMVTDGYNADFDGDAMSLYVPVSNEAVNEALNMAPSASLLSPTTGGLVPKLKQEMIIGLNALTQVDKKPARRFSTKADVEEAYDKGKLKLGRKVNIDELGGRTTTLGRLRLRENLTPELVKVYGDRVSHDLDFQMDGKGANAMLRHLADHKEARGEWRPAAQNLMSLGNQTATEIGFSAGLDDITPNREIQAKVLGAAKRKYNQIVNAPAGMSKTVKDKLTIRLFDQAAKDLDKELAKHYKANPGKSTIADMVESGARGKPSQSRQILGAPVLVKDAKERPIPMPILTSFSDGLDTADYWTHLHGARRGLLSRAQGTTEPGALTKRIINASMSTIVAGEDCDTDEGVIEHVDGSIVGRYLASPAISEDKTFQKDTMVTPEVLADLKKGKIKTVQIRSPLRCAHGEGVCQKCYGVSEDGEVPKLGTNIGVIAAQAIGAPSTQLAMDSFHTGSVASSRGAQAVDRFTELKYALDVQKKMKGSAILASKGGEVTTVEKDPESGGHRIAIGASEHYIPPDRNLLLPFKKGDVVRPGQALTTGRVNPNELLTATGDIRQVQETLVKQLDDVMRSENVRKIHSEVLVKNMTDVAEVLDSGDADNVVRGDRTTQARLRKVNRDLRRKKKKPVEFRQVLRPIGQVPLDAVEDWMARLQHERLRTTVSEAAHRGWKSDIHGQHPVPGLAYGTEFGKSGRPTKPY
jgi:DNA-directed RNA polymerase subunit beta'